MEIKSIETHSFSRLDLLTEMSKTLSIAITGGIGSGKSTVCKMLSAMGFPVYDCDSRAKKIMDSSSEIHAQIARKISSEAICRDNSGNTSINRKHLANIVFNNSSKLEALNGIVHSAVKEDIMSWCDEMLVYGAKAVFVETAIPHSSGIDCMVEEIWEVTAPVETRIFRAMKRDNDTRSNIIARIESQASETEYAGDARLYHIINNGVEALMPQLLKILQNDGLI